MILIDGAAILTAAEMRAAEETHGDLAGLMERAGAGVADAARRLAAGAEVLVLCGPGNNGGDGYVAARVLREGGHPVRVAALAPPATDLARAAAAGWTRPVVSLAEAAPAPVLVDALFGTGLSRGLAGDAVAGLHRLAAAARTVIAVDLPSGLATDDGTLLSEPPRAHLTLALGALKPAHLLQPAARFCGRVRLIELGVAVAARTHAIRAPILAEPGPDSHKFTRGMVAIVGGTMPGASELAAIAAMRAGSGYVLYLGEGQGAPHALVRRPWSAQSLADPRIGSVVIGPGLGRDAAARGHLDAAMATDRPLVIDGDALHLLDPAIKRPFATVLTPHGGEFAALFGPGEGSKIDRSRAAAARTGAVVVFKGADTVVAAPDGRIVVTADSSDWLSTAGTGDVLAGACGAMLAACGDPFAAAVAAVWLHGRAARACGRSFIADDLAQALSAVR